METDRHNTMVKTEAEMNIGVKKLSFKSFKSPNGVVIHIVVLGHFDLRKLKILKKF